MREMGPIRLLTLVPLAVVGLEPRVVVIVQPMARTDIAAGKATVMDVIDAEGGCHPVLLDIRLCE